MVPGSNSDGKARGAFWARRTLIRQAALSVQQKWLLAVLHDLFGANDCCWPGMDTLALDMSLSPRQLRAVVRSLKDAGIVQLQKRRQNTAVFTIDWNALESCQQDRRCTSGLNVQDWRSTAVKTGGLPPLRPAVGRRRTLHRTQKEHKENIKSARNPRFVKPTLEEVAAYCRERQNGIDAVRFIDHYDSNGWRVGRNPMKDWKAAVRTWERNDVQRNGRKDRRGEMEEWITNQ